MIYLILGLLTIPCVLFVWSHEDDQITLKHVLCVCLLCMIWPFVWFVGILALLDGQFDIVLWRRKP